MYRDWTPEDKAKGPGIPDDDQGLRGIQDFVGFGTSRGSRLRRTRDFVGFKTLQNPGLHGIQDSAENRNLHTRTRILFCGVLPENTNFPHKIKTWTPLGIRLVVSVKYCVLFLWLLGARTLPKELYGAK